MRTELLLHHRRLIVCLAASAFAGLSTSDRAFAQTRPKVTIVSLGDSAASGEGNPDEEGSFQPNARWLGTDAGGWLAQQDKPCHRSKKAGPRLAADSFRSRHPEYEVVFTSFACSGAQAADLADIAGPRSHDGTDGPRLAVLPEGPINLPLQVDQVRQMYGSEPIDALILSIGINDVGFAHEVKRCLGLDDCSSPSSSGYPDVLGLVEALRGRYDALKARIQAALPNVRTVLVTEYPDALTDESGQFCDHGPRVSVGSPWGPVQTSAPDLSEPLSSLSATESRWASEQGIQKLNSIIHDRATAFAPDGWRAVGNIANRFHGHGYCADNRWVNTIKDSLRKQGDPSGSVHPNGDGHAVYRDAIVAALESVVITPGAPQMGRVGNPDPTLRFTVSDQGITLRWTPSDARALEFQVAHREVAYRADGLGGAAPTSAPGALADLSADGGAPWVRVRLQDPNAREWTHAVANSTRDYSVRACSATLCSPWTPPVQVSNTVPQAPFSLRPDLLTAPSPTRQVCSGTGPNRLCRIQVGFPGLIRMTWGSDGDVHRVALQVATKPRGGSSWRTEVLGAGITRYAFTADPAGIHDFAIRACALALCSAWHITWASNQPTTGPLRGVALNRVTDTIHSYTWEDTSSNETAYQLAIHTGAGRYAFSDLPGDSTSSGVTDLYGYAYLRACNDVNCLPWTGTLRPPQDVLELRPARPCIVGTPCDGPSIRRPPAPPRPDQPPPARNPKVPPPNAPLPQLWP